MIPHWYNMYDIDCMDVDGTWYTVIWYWIDDISSGIRDIILESTPLIFFMKCQWYCLIKVHDIMLIWLHAIRCSIAKPFWKYSRKLRWLGDVHLQNMWFFDYFSKIYHNLHEYYSVRWSNDCIYVHWLNRKGWWSISWSFPCSCILRRRPSVSYIQEQEKYLWLHHLPSVLIVPHLCV